MMTMRQGANRAVRALRTQFMRAALFLSFVLFLLPIRSDAVEAKIYRGDLYLGDRTVGNLSLRYPVLTIRGDFYIPVTDEFLSAIGLSVLPYGMEWKSGAHGDRTECGRLYLQTIESRELSDEVFGETVDIRRILPLAGAAYIDDDMVRSNLPMYSIDGVAYLCIDYTNDFNQTGMDLLRRNGPAQTGDLPAAYNTFERLSASDFVRNQGSAQTCWAFAANSMIEIKLALSGLGVHNFSEEHLIAQCPIPSTSLSGGNWNGSAAYYTRGFGPVEEGPPADSLFRIKEYRGVSGVDEVKAAIYKNGSVLTSIYYGPFRREYYNPDQFAYYHNNAMQLPTHELILIGWDDSFSKTRFKEAPPSDGAFIAMNSFGTDFGENGLFYISYCDDLALKRAVTVDAVEAHGGEWSVLSSDRTGVTHYETWPSKGNLYAIVRMKLEGDPKRIRGVGVFSAGNALVTAYYSQEFPLTEDGMALLGDVYFEEEGYKVIDSYYNILARDEFYIVLKYTSSERFVIPIEAPYPGIDYVIASLPETNYIAYEDKGMLVAEPLEKTQPEGSVVLRLMLE